MNGNAGIAQKVQKVTGSNPVIHSDFPDPDIIRVDDAYYMASTTMFLMPGCDDFAPTI